MLVMLHPFKEREMKFTMKVAYDFALGLIMFIALVGSVYIFGFQMEG